MSCLARPLSVLMFLLASIPAFSAPPQARQTLPITFEPNRGQAPSQYGYVFHRDGMYASFLRNGVDFALAGRARGENPIHIALLGGNAESHGQDLLGGHSNYFLGNDSSRWMRNVPLYYAVE